MKKALNLIGSGLLIVLILAVFPLNAPKLFGVSIYNVQTGSMEPEIPTNSVIYVLPEKNPENIKPGDIITYKLESNTNLVGTHRVVSIDYEKELIVTKGDRNESQDQTPVSFKSVIGKVVFHIPYLGYLAGFIGTGAGVAVLISLFAVVLLLWMAADRLRRKENAR